MKDDDILFGEYRQARPRKSVATWKIVAWCLVAIAASALIGLVIRISSDRHLRSVAREAFAEHPVVRQHLGEWKDCSVIAFVRDKQDPEPDLTGVMYEVHGTKGDGILIVIFFIKADHIHAAQLVTDAEVIELVVPEPVPQ